MRYLSLALAGSLLLPIAAKADTVNFTVTGSAGGYTGTGVLTGTSNGDGSYTITSITGPAAYGPLSIVAAGDPFLGNDNLFFPDGVSTTDPSLVDSNGIGFSGSFGEAVIFSSPYYVAGYDPSGNPFGSSLTLTLDSSAVVTPEPSSIVLTMTGLLGAAMFLNRKRILSTFSQPIPTA